MPMTTSDILRQRTARINAILSGQTVPPLPGAPRIEVLVPDEADADEAYRIERADYDGGEG